MFYGEDGAELYGQILAGIRLLANRMARHFWWRVMKDIWCGLMSISGSVLETSDKRVIACR